MKKKTLFAFLVIWSVAVFWPGATDGRPPADMNTANIFGPLEACVASSHHYDTDAFLGADYDWTVTGGTLLEGDETPQAFVLWWDEGIGHLALTVTLADGTVLTSDVWVEILVNDLSTTADFPVGICAGTNSGYIDLTVSGTGSSFEYFWNTNATTEDIFDLGPGAYKVTVTSELGCQAHDGFLLFEAPLPAYEIELEPMVCETLGSLSIVANNPTCGHWEVQPPSDVMAGTHTFSVLDCFGCTHELIVEVPNVEDTLTVDASVQNPTPGNGDGTIGLTILGGSPPYSFFWENGSTDNPQTDLPAGGYTVTVSDANGCTATATFQLTEMVNGTSEVSQAQNTAVFPNPSDGIFTLETHLPQAEKMSVKLLNPAGEILQELFREKTMGAGKHQLFFQLNDWPAGLYLLEIKIGATVFAKQMVKK